MHTTFLLAPIQAVQPLSIKEHTMVSKWPPSLTSITDASLHSDENVGAGDMSSENNKNSTGSHDPLSECPNITNIYLFQISTEALKIGPSQPKKCNIKVYSSAVTVSSCSSLKNSLKKQHPRQGKHQTDLTETRLKRQKSKHLHHQHRISMGTLCWKTEHIWIYPLWPFHEQNTKIQNLTG